MRARPAVARSVRGCRHRLQAAGAAYNGTVVQKQPGKRPMEPANRLRLELVCPVSATGGEGGRGGGGQGDYSPQSIVWCRNRATTLPSQLYAAGWVRIQSAASRNSANLRSNSREKAPIRGEQSAARYLSVSLTYSTRWWAPNAACAEQEEEARVFTVLETSRRFRSGSHSVLSWRCVHQAND